MDESIDVSTDKLDNKLSCDYNKHISKFLEDDRTLKLLSKMESMSMYMCFRTDE